MRFAFLALFALLLCTPFSFAQDYGLEEEVVNENIGVLIGALGVVDLTGYSCTRYYVTMNNEDDFMSSVSGDAVNPTYVNTTTTFYNAALGAATPNGINSLLFAVYPDLPFDSWVTIGLEGVPNAGAGEAAIATVQSTDNPWSNNFDPGFGAPGGNIAIDDPIGGAWYALNGDANGVAGTDLKVLVGQFTTDGALSGQLYCQVFINGDGSQEYRETFFIGAPPAVPGCIDNTACNYNAEATEDDGSCTYADAGLNCDGSCIDDADGDGVCDGDEVPGCTDAEATNYSEMATDDDGSCTYGCAPEWGDAVILPAVTTVLAQVTNDGGNASADDLVGAFINGELRGEGTIIDFEGATYVNMTVYLAGGEETITFTLFDAVECATCNISTELTTMGSADFGSFDDPLMFDANCSEATVEADLEAGWNYVSTNVTPDSYGIASMFESPLEGNLLKVLGDNNFALGQSYTPGIPSVFNSLQMHMDAAGYVIKVENAATWTSTGAPLEVNNTPLDLNEGWNIIGYVPQNTMAVETALASIDGLVGTVIDGQNGTVWNPANPNEFNSLLDLEPGRSYWVRMIEAGTLTYAEDNGEDGSGDGSGMVTAHLRTDDNAATMMTGWEVVRTPSAAALAVEIVLDASPILGEAYIGAFVNETCVAARPVLASNGFSAAQMALMLDGPSNVSFKLWVDGEVFASSDEMPIEPGEEWGQGGETLPVIHFQSTAHSVASPDWVQSFSIAPVPAQGETWINLDLNRGGQVFIQVLDARGATVATVYDGQWPAGGQRMLLNVAHWAAGTYFIKGLGDHGTFSAPLIVK
jgi:hypothetical protein